MSNDYVNLYTKDLSTKRWPSDINFLIAFWGSIVLLLFFLVFYGMTLIDYYKESNKNKSLVSEYQDLSVKDKELMALSVRLRELNIKSKAISETISNLNSLFQKKVKWTKFIETFSGYLNDNVWIDSLNVDLVGDNNNFLYIQVQGGAISLKDLNNFVESVENENKNVKISFKVIDKKGIMFYSFGMNFTFPLERLK